MNEAQDLENKRAFARRKGFDVEMGQLEFTSSSSLGEALNSAEREEENESCCQADNEDLEEKDAALEEKFDDKTCLLESGRVAVGIPTTNDGRVPTLLTKASTTAAESGSNLSARAEDGKGDQQSTSDDQNDTNVDEMEDSDSDEDGFRYMRQESMPTMQRMSTVERMSLLAEMDESLQEGNPEYARRKSDQEAHLSARRVSDQQTRPSNRVRSPSPNGRRRSDQVAQHSPSPPNSPSHATNFLSKRSESIKKHHSQMQNAQSQYSRRLQEWQNRQGMSQDTDSEDDDTLLMMIAKKRAAMGGEDDGVDIRDPHNNSQQNEKQKRPSDRSRGRQMHDTNEVQLPGAYAKAPGDTFRRVRSFQKESFVIRRPSVLHDTLQNAKQEAMAAAIRDSSSSRSRSPKHRGTSPSRSRSSQRPKSPPDSPTRVSRRQRTALKKMEMIMSPQQQQQIEDESDLDRKPAAKPSLAKRHTTVLCGSNHSLVSTDSSERERKNRAKSLPSADAAATLLSDYAASPTAPKKGSFVSAGLGRRGRHSSFASSITSRTSLNLASLARSITLDSGSDSSSFGNASAQLVVDIAEQSVSNFVRNFQKQPSSEHLPIAATVVPSEEDLECLIRSRLEAELQSHLTQELSHFRQNLFDGLIRSGQVQVADPVMESGSDDDIELGYDTSERRDPNHRTYLEMFQDEEEDSAELNESDQDRVTALDSAAASRPANRRLGGLGEDFRRSIRQSIRMEFGNLEEELDVEQAQVISASGRGDSGLEPTMSSSQDEISTVRTSEQARRQPKAKGRDKQFVFSPRGLLGCVFVIFLMGALVGAGVSIWVMESVRGE